MKRGCTERGGREGSTLTCANQRAWSAPQQLTLCGGGLAEQRKKGIEWGVVQSRELGKADLWTLRGRRGSTGGIAGMERGRGVGMRPGGRSCFPETFQAPGTPGDQTCGSRRARLSLGFSRRRRGGAGGSSRCEARE